MGHIPIFSKDARLKGLIPRGSHAAMLLYHAAPCGGSATVELGRHRLNLTKASVKASRLVSERARSQDLVCANLRGGQACRSVRLQGDRLRGDAATQSNGSLSMASSK